MALVPYSTSLGTWTNTTGLMNETNPIDSIALLAIPVLPVISYATTRMFMALCKPTDLPALPKEKDEEEENEEELQPFDPEETLAPFEDEDEEEELQPFDPEETLAPGMRFYPIPPATQQNPQQHTATQPQLQSMDTSSTLATFESSELTYKIHENAVVVEKDGNNFLFKFETSGFLTGRLFATLYDAPAGRLVNLNGQVMPLDQFLEVIEITEYTPPKADPSLKGGDLRSPIKVVAESVLCVTKKGRSFVIKGASVPLVLQALQTLV